MSSRRKQYKPKAAFGETDLESITTITTPTEDKKLIDETVKINEECKQEAIVENDVPGQLVEQQAASTDEAAPNSIESSLSHSSVQQESDEQMNRKRKREQQLEAMIPNEKRVNLQEVEEEEDQESGSNPSSSSSLTGEQRLVQRQEGTIDLDDEEDEEGEEEDVMGEETMYEGLENDENGMMDDELDMEMYSSQTGAYMGNDLSGMIGSARRGGGAKNESSMDAGGNSNDPNSSLLLVFKCKVCGKGFKHRRSLNRHVKLHSGEKNFKCPLCSTAFARSDHLKAHIRTHNNTKPYRCSVCHCGYSTQAALKVHIAHHHSKSKFRCVLCNNLEFHSQLALEGHIYTKHSKENNKTDISELINETAHINPEVLNADDATNYNLINQRTRLIEINNYTNLNKSSSSSSSGDGANSSNANNQQNQVNSNTPLNNNRYSSSLPDMLAAGSNGQLKSSNNHYDGGQSDTHSNEENDFFAGESGETNDNEIIETTESHRNHIITPSQQQSKRPNGTPLSSSNHRPPYNHLSAAISRTSSSPSNPNNTYCELCNARFSSVDSYAAHMRNCHPSSLVVKPPTAAVVSNGETNKMPYLTSILSTPSNNSGKNNSASSAVVKQSPLMAPIAHHNSR